MHCFHCNKTVHSKQTADVEIKDGAICLVMTDSNNDSTINMADRDASVKNNPQYPGRVLRVNTDDDDKNGELDKWQRPDQFNTAMNPAALAGTAPSVIVQDEDDLAAVILYAWIDPDGVGSHAIDVYSIFPNDLVMWTASTKGSRLHRGEISNGQVTTNTKLATLTSGTGKNVFTRTVYMEANAAVTGNVELHAKFTDNHGHASGYDSAKMTSVDVDLDIDSDNDGTVSRSGYEDSIEESSPGKLIEASKTSAMENREQMVLEISNGDIWGASTTVSFAIPAHFKVYKSSSGTSTQIVSGTSYTLNQLGISPGGTLTLYVGATQASAATGVDKIIVTADPDGSGPLPAVTDTVVMTAYEFKYVRVYDENKIPNRSTRAVGEPEDLHLYEDNPRSDYDMDGTPGIVLGGYGVQMSYANIATEVEFTPDGIGEFFLWKISANNGCSLGTSSSGSFASGKTISNVIYPSSAIRATHNERTDIVISVGFDKNGDGILQEDEKSVPDFANRIIGKNEYDYCYSQLTSWLNFAGGIWWPQAGELLQIFTGLNYIADYDSTRNIIQKYGGTHQMSNALGLDETVNIIQGQVVEYIWNFDSIFSNKILKDNDFFNTVIAPEITNLSIGEFYQNNPFVTNKMFVINIDTVFMFPAGTSDNLHNSLKHCEIKFQLYLYTERGSTTPQITGIAGSGLCEDFYDFRTYGNDDNNGWASRVQTCHVHGVRDAGEVYSIQIDLLVPETHFWWDVYFDDLSTLKSKWDDVVDSLQPQI